ncbi:hypothetical protein LCGC14_3007330, partial [marine sediment metagenome]
TLWIDGEPQVEVKFHVRLPFLAKDGHPIIYQGTIDRICFDRFGLLWLLDYKTAKTIQTGHLETDTQVSSYCWAGASLFEQPIAGLIYQQHKKTLPEPPRWLQSGRFSCNKDQRTTRHLYKEGLIRLYGDVSAAPNENIIFLNWLTEKETEFGDGFIQRDFAKRNDHQHQAEGTKICLEAAEMVDPDLALYPNSTRDCSWDCTFYQACVSMDDGSDWEFEIENTTKKRPSQEESWRNHLKWPETVDLSQVQ